MAEQNRAVGLALLYDLFDLQKVTDLPPAFLEDFSRAPGQDGELFAEGPFKGWPLRVLQEVQEVLRLGGNPQVIRGRIIPVLAPNACSQRARRAAVGTNNGARRGVESQRKLGHFWGGSH